MIQCRQLSSLSNVLNSSRLARSVSEFTMYRAPRWQPGAPVQSRRGETTTGTQYVPVAFS
jgi:hypothetical protein